MAKATYLNDLLKSYDAEKKARWVGANSPYKNMDKSRWLEVMNSYNRKVIRKRRRSVGKSNKYGMRLTASSLAVALHQINTIAQVCRANRAYLAAQEQK